MVSVTRNELTFYANKTAATSNKSNLIVTLSLICIIYIIRMHYF